MATMVRRMSGMGLRRRTRNVAAGLYALGVAWDASYAVGADQGANYPRAALERGGDKGIAYLPEADAEKFVLAHWASGRGGSSWLWRRDRGPLGRPSLDSMMGCTNSSQAMTADTG